MLNCLSTPLRQSQISCSATPLTGESACNSALLIGPDGAEIGKYRKVQLPGSVEPREGARFQQLENAISAAQPDSRRHRLRRAPRRRGLTPNLMMTAGLSLSRRTR